MPSASAPLRKNRRLALGHEAYFFNEIDPFWRSGITLAGVAAVDLPGTLRTRSAVADGLATSAEVALWPLSGTDLVVVSACVTAQGDLSYADGVRGLPNALAIAGAGHSLLTLWPVNDADTSAFIIRFYEHLTSGATDYAQSLALTQRDALNERLGAPVGKDAWQAFVLYSG